MKIDNDELPPPCDCQLRGQPMTPAGVLHRQECEWLRHPQGGSFALSDASAQELLRLIEQDDEDEGL